ncbi:P-loop containing nucleoside triphosphate hydrolase protein [Mycena crocata]|nr:P-loop containing nucleoside triphosphate hydrolase protein [Mycena crocata]
MDPLEQEIQLPMSQNALNGFRALPNKIFMETLTPSERIIVLDAFLYLDFASNGKMIPRELQLRATIAVRQGKDLLARSGTGTGKTIAMILPVLMMPKDAVVITVSPLRLIQDNHVSEFSKYGIPSIAINCYTPDDRALWKKIQDHSFYQHYSVSPEQCGDYKGHTQRFAKLLHDPKWTKKIKLVQIDEAHFIETAGQAKGKEGPFRPAFSNLGERIRVHLPSTTPMTAYSASMPTRVMDLLMKTLRMSPSNTVKLEFSTNRPNLVHATIRMVGTIDNFANVDFLVPLPCPPDYVPPKCIIFLDDKKKSTQLETYLNSRASPTNKEFFRHYHSSMSKQYLEETVAAFKAGYVQGLIATDCASNGFDDPSVSLVVEYGVPKTLFDKDQRGGRGGRDGRECLVLTIAEAWAFDNLAASDPDHKPCAKEQRTDPAVIADASSKACRRRTLARNNNDNTPLAVTFTSRDCCDCCSPDFDLSRYLPGPILTANDEVVMEEHIKKPRRKYRPVKQREGLILALERWRTGTHSSDPVARNFSPTFIFPDESLPLLARELPSRLRIPRDVTTFLEETDEWHSQYALNILSVIIQYDSALVNAISGSDSDESSSSDESTSSDSDTPSTDSESDVDQIRSPTQADAAAVITPSPPSSSSSSRTTTPEPPAPPLLTAAGRPLRRAAIKHSVAGIAKQVAKRQKV